MFISEIVYKPALVLNTAEKRGFGEQAVEIYNPTDSVLDLSDYTIVLVFINSSTEEYSLEGSIEPGEAFVIGCQSFLSLM